MAVPTANLAAVIADETVFNMAPGGHLAKKRRPLGKSGLVGIAEVIELGLARRVILQHPEGGADALAWFDGLVRGRGKALLPVIVATKAGVSGARMRIPAV